MLITIPGHAHGRRDAGSVLDLEPLLTFTRQCRPDAVSLMPPMGADDQPNGAALLAMKNRLEEEGLRVVAGCWKVDPNAPVMDAAWQLEGAFEARGVVAALGEAGVGPLTLDWQAPLGDAGGRQALSEFLARIMEEAERAQVRIALHAGAGWDELAQLVREGGSAFLGLCCSVQALHADSAAQSLRSLKDTLMVLRDDPVRYFGIPASTEEWNGWPEVVRTLSEIPFAGPLHLSLPRTPVEYAHAIGYMRGLQALGNRGSILA